MLSGPGQFRAGDLPPARGHGQGQGQEAPARILPLRPMRRHRHLPAAAVQVSRVEGHNIEKKEFKSKPSPWANEKWGSSFFGLRAVSPLKFPIQKQSLTS